MMFYESELLFLRETFKKYRLQTHIIDPLSPIDDKVDMGLRILLYSDKEDNKHFCDYFPNMQDNTVYKLTDAFMCKYIFFFLPDTENPVVMVVGPYICTDFTRQHILENAEKLGVQPREIKQLEHYLNGIPLIPDELTVFALLDTFCERIWGGSRNFTVADINRENTAAFATASIKGNDKTPEERMWNMQLMENRYSYENELMQAVSQGLSHKAELMLTSFSASVFEKRVSDPLRNIKNYCIIMNTLLRKAAENGGVHPIYLDSISSAYAQKIEALPSTAKTGDFMVEMFRSYCNLVKTHSINKYSPAIQKTIICIDADLTADLSLHTMAKMNNVSASYLSSLFKKETGETLTEFVNKRRVKLAKNLLKTTNLQIQTIAQHCGILDVHYFSKIFKKLSGVTPKEYRGKAEA